MRESRTPRLLAVMDFIRARINSQAMPAGARLPSVRSLAKSQGVAVSTVVEAYQRLRAEGLLRSQRGSGYYVRPAQMPLVLSQLGPKLDRAIDPLWVSRQSLEASPKMMMPGCGWLPAAWMPQDVLRRALRNAARLNDDGLADYATPQGLLPLRQLLSRQLAERDCIAAPDRIILTGSATHAVDLLCRFFLKPADTVLIDDPCYFNFRALLRAHGAKIVSVPYTEAGPDVEVFAGAIERHQPKLYLTNAGVHNPTGATLSPVIAHRVLKLADAAGLIIIEDDVFADFEAQPAPRLAAFDGFERVIGIGSFSKTLSASTRCGYMVLPHKWTEPLIDLKIATQFGSGHLEQHIVLHALQDAAYQRHLSALRPRLAKVMAQTIAALALLGIVPWHRPQAGMLLWCRLPPGMEAEKLAQRSLQHNIVLAPGNVFSAAQSASAFMRFNVAQMQDAKIYAALGKAMAS